MASRAQASNAGRLLVAVVLFLGPVSQLCSSSAAEAATPVAQARQQVALPTPRSHYDTFKPGTSGLPLLLDLLKQLDPETQKVLLRLAMASGVHDIGADPELASGSRQATAHAQRAGHRLDQADDLICQSPTLTGVLPARVARPANDSRKVGKYLGAYRP